jgi:probable rRNA maturation factor
MSAAARRVARRVLAAAGLDGLEVGVRFVDDDEMRALNRAWRGKDRPTDVLSFSAHEGEPMPGLEHVLGDLVVSLDTAKAQALSLGHTFDEEVAVLIAHGLLHLLGLDHERGRAEALLQAELEMSVLAAAGVDPLLALGGRGFC